MVFEKLKLSLMKKLEENSVKSEMEWKDVKGESHKETVYMKRSRLPLVGDWTRIYPPVNENGKWNKINLIFGGRTNFIKFLMFLFIVILFFVAYKEIALQYSNLANNLCVKGCFTDLVEKTYPLLK